MCYGLSVRGRLKTCRGFLKGVVDKGMVGLADVVGGVSELGGSGM